MLSGTGEYYRYPALAAVERMLFSVNDDDDRIHTGLVVVSGDGKADTPIPVGRCVRNCEGIQDRGCIVDGKGTAADLIGIVRVILRGQADTDVLSCLG